MVDYTELNTFKRAIHSEDARDVQRCLQAGQVVDIDLLEYAIDEGVGPLCTILSFKNHFDLKDMEDSYGDNVLWYVPLDRPELWHLLLQAGADANHKNQREKTIFSDFDVFSDRDLAIALMLLSSGGDPDNIDVAPPLRSEFHEQVKHWLVGFVKAKNAFKKIFDNPELEKELCDFIFIEKHLRKAMYV